LNPDNVFWDGAKTVRINWPGVSSAPRWSFFQAPEVRNGGLPSNSSDVFSFWRLFFALIDHRRLLKPSATFATLPLMAIAVLDRAREGDHAGARLRAERIAECCEQKHDLSALRSKVDELLRNTP
jgi:hypothetical protein